jgi:hypothetical protein
MTCVASQCRYPTPTPGAIGSSCTDDRDCLATECNEKNVCSRRCVSSATDCPAGFACENIGGIAYYCMPSPAPPPSTSSSCAIACATPSSSSPSQGGLLGALIAGAVVARRARRRGLPCMRAAPSLGALALIACSTHDPSRDPGGHDAGPFAPDACKSSLAQTPFVVVGKGQTLYAELAENEVLTWEKGPQGGHHVWIALRLTGLRQVGTVTTIDLDDLDQPDPMRTRINHSRVIYDFTRDEGGYCTLPGLRMQLDNAGGTPLASLINHHIRVGVTLQDPDGARATSSKTIVVTGALD